MLNLTTPSFEELAENRLLNFGLLFGEILSQKVLRKDGWKPEYFIPRFFADCAKHSGFSGIKYQSARWLRENLVLFSWLDSDIEPIGDPVRFHLEEGHVSLTGFDYKSEFIFYTCSDADIETLVHAFNARHGL